MKLKDAAIYWDPRPGGRCVVAPFGRETVVTRALPCSTGSVHTKVCTLSPVKARAFVLAEALHMIIRDGLDPQTVHKALLEIDEYRTACANDMPGVQPRRAPFRS